MQRFRDMNWPMIKLLMQKDWQLYQTQLAAYVGGLIVALTLIGTGKTVPFYLGALLLLCLLLCAGGFSIQSSVLNERNQKTLAFVMSLPITPKEFVWAKLLINSLIYLVPFGLVVIGSALLILTTTFLPDGLLIWALLLFGYLASIFFISLAVAMTVETEGVIIFVMITLCTLVSPFMFLLNQIKGISSHMRGNDIVLNWQAVSVFAIELAIIVLALSWASYSQSRKSSFL